MDSDNHEGLDMNTWPSSFYYMPSEMGTSGTDMGFSSHLPSTPVPIRFIPREMCTSGTDTGFSSHLPSVPVPIRFIPNPVSHFPLQTSQSCQSSFQTASPSPVPFQQPVPVNTSTSLSTDGTELVKKKKEGRPRKYFPEGSVGLALSPISGSAPQSSSSGQKRKGRPPGTGTKQQQFASFGEWMVGSAGMGFTPHVIRLSVGEDIFSKIMAFAQQGPRAICVLSANGSVSKVTLRQPSYSYPGSITYKGRFEILTLNGSFMLCETDNGSYNRTGWLSVSLSSPDGRVFGGSVAGLLIAASPIQLIVGSFVYAGAKEKKEEKESEQVTVDNSHLDLSDTKMQQPF
ncbi:hypothetical protein LUZ60_016786 [Juncus effusus]|nr:hypothetical protein LUZ60_016786 [Juncus effusus]